MGQELAVRRPLLPTPTSLALLGEPQEIEQEMPMVAIFVRLGLCLVTFAFSVIGYLLTGDVGNFIRDRSVQVVCEVMGIDQPDWPVRPSQYAGLSLAYLSSMLQWLCGLLPSFLLGWSGLLLGGVLEEMLPTLKAINLEVLFSCFGLFHRGASFLLWALSFEVQEVIWWTQILTNTIALVLLLHFSRRSCDRTRLWKRNRLAPDFFALLLPVWTPLSVATSVPTLVKEIEKRLPGAELQASYDTWNSRLIGLIRGISVWRRD